MTDTLSWFGGLQQSAVAILNETLAYLPALGAAILVLIGGWLIARLARAAARRIFNDANRLLDRVFRHGAFSSARLSPATVTVLGEVTFWVMMFLTVTVSARVAGLTVIATWLNQIVTQLPNLIVGAAIIVVGYFLSVLVGEQVASTARAAKAGQSALMGKFAQAAVFVTTLIIGLDQIGVDVTFLVALFAVAVGAIFVGFSIAFGLGARHHVGNLIGARNARRELRLGASIRIGGNEGRILEITATHIILDSANGRMLVPASITDEGSIEITAPDESKETAHG